MIKRITATLQQTVMQPLRQSWRHLDGRGRKPAARIEAWAERKGTQWGCLDAVLFDLALST